MTPRKGQCLESWEGAGARRAWPQAQEGWEHLVVVNLGCEGVGSEAAGSMGKA